MPKQSLKRWIDDAESALRELGKRSRKSHNAAYMGTDLEFLGVSTPELRRLYKESLKNPPADWEECAQALWDRPILELRFMAIALAAKEQDNFRKAHWKLFTAWLNECVGWAMVDVFCDSVLTPMIEKYPELADKTTAWTKAKNLWLRRASLVTFCRLLRNGSHAELAFAHAAALIHDRDPMITKAESWLLRSAIQHYRSNVEKFLKDHADELAPLAMREVRNKLLTGTKSGRTNRNR